MEKEYIIPLRREWNKVSSYRRTGKAIVAIKKFIAKHMKIADRDLSKIKIDTYFNNQIWFRGRKSPPAKLKVRAIKEGEFVRVTFPEIPQNVKYTQSKHERRHKASDVKKTPDKKEDKKDEQKLEEKIEEKEKGQAVAEQHIKEAEQESKVKKHISKVKEERYHRITLKK